MLDGAGAPTAWALYTPGSPHFTLLSININTLLSNSKRVDTILAVVRDLLPLFTPVNSSTAVHRIGKLLRGSKWRDPGVVQRVRSSPLYDQLLLQIVQSVGDMAPRGLSNCLWGLAAAGEGGAGGGTHGVVAAICRRMLAHPIESLQLQELSNMVYALACLEVRDTELLDFLLEGAIPNLPHFIPQGLSNMVWGCATLQYTHPAFLNAVAEESSRRVAEFQPQSITNMMWGFSSLGVYPEKLFQAVAEDIIKRQRSRVRGGLQDFKDQEVSSLLISFARANVIDPPLLTAIEKDLCRPGRLGGFGRQALSNTLWALATLRWYPQHVLPHITAALEPVVAGMQSQEIANILWAYARLGYHPGSLLGSFLREVALTAHTFPPQTCTNTIWALAVLQASHSRAFVHLIRRFVELEARQEATHPSQYNQVLQAVLAAQLEGSPGTFREEIDLPDQVVVEALEAWQKLETRVSEFHLNVSQSLALLGVEHEVEHMTAGDLFSVDIAILGPEGSRIAVEVDGPYHYPVNSNKPLGHTIVRRRILRAGGWRVVSIPHFEWYPMYGNRAAQLKYLVQKLGRADPAMLPLLAASLAGALHQLDNAEKAKGEAAAGEPPAPAADVPPDAAAAAAVGAADAPPASLRETTTPVAYLRHLASREGVTLTRGAHRLLREWAQHAGLERRRQRSAEPPSPPEAAAVAPGTATPPNPGVVGREEPGAMSDGEGDTPPPASPRPPGEGGRGQSGPLPGEVLEEGEWQQGQRQSLDPRDQEVLQKLISLGHVKDSWISDARARPSGDPRGNLNLDPRDPQRSLLRERPPPQGLVGAKAESRGGRARGAGGQEAGGKLQGGTAGPASPVSPPPALAAQRTPPPPPPRANPMQLLAGSVRTGAGSLPRRAGPAGRQLSTQHGTAAQRWGDATAARTEGQETGSKKGAQAPPGSKGAPGASVTRTTNPPPVRNPMRQRPPSTPATPADLDPRGSADVDAPGEGPPATLAPPGAAGQVTRTLGSTLARARAPLPAPAQRRILPGSVTQAKRPAVLAPRRPNPGPQPPPERGTGASDGPLFSGTPPVPSQPSPQPPLPRRAAPSALSSPKRQQPGSSPAQGSPPPQRNPPPLP